MEQRIAEAIKAAFGDQGQREAAANNSQNTSITINGDITIQVTVKKKKAD
ncbi:hypothetical protein [Marinobacterium rhizophilum]|uniref:Uncharacterized protein n=1 Tax=Marinobacterium rhizophilum TaxID=420402 RepID=A0ABY5HN02_9GAMM|nr:hypothetical protein [Marinobacterium rhizophilum]UTW12963.1 hypothetical protein KDW95_04620 [Marinobacterium rhizophilum]